MTGTLTFKDGSKFIGKSFGADTPRAGEIVFSTGMMGYPESLTDPSYKGQILVLTYPLIGNYGVPDKSLWESNNIMISGLIVSNYIDTPSHFQSKKTLSQWLKEKGVPALEIKDTRYLTQKIRDEGVSLSKIIFDRDIDFYDPNTENLVEQVSSKKINLLKARNSNRTILLIDCGTKRNIQKALLKAGVNVLTIPWDFDPFEQKEIETIKKLLPNQKKLFDGIVVSNGPGDPKFVSKTIQTIQKSMKRELPTLGICLGHQLLALAAGGTTKKLKYGHRSQNQPCVMEDSNRCFITTQNHGFAVDKIPSGFKKWFTNANDKTNEGLIHKRFPFMSVQFHPEATPGPEDADWIFDYFLKHI